MLSIKAALYKHKHKIPTPPMNINNFSVVWIIKRNDYWFFKKKIWEVGQSGCPVTLVLLKCTQNTVIELSIQPMSLITELAALYKTIQINNIQIIKVNKSFINVIYLLLFFHCCFRSGLYIFIILWISTSVYKDV